MAHYVSRIIRLLLLLAAPLAFATGPLDHPQLPSLETKIEYLLYVNQEVPGLFSDASKYSIDLLDLLDKQGKTAQELHLMPSYAELLKQRPPLRDIEIAPAPKSRVINKDMLLRWRSETLKSLDALASAHPQSAPKAVLLQSVLSNTTPLTRANPSAFLAGLISTLPKEKRAELSALPLEQQIARLERELPAELIGAGFRPAPYGITSATLSRSEALQKLNGLLKNQTNLQPLISILLSSDKPERFPNSWSALKTHIAELPEDEFASLADKQIRRTRIEAWIPSLTVANPSLESDRAMTVMLHEAENRLKRITSESAGAPDLSRPLVLKEMPPSVAIYRGCAGGDCSTSSSWAYPNSPNDRVYLIQDAKGVKGYASGTILKVNGKSTFFLHTIAGPRISSAEARIVIQGLHLARTDLGVKQIALGTPAQINAANNENVIRAEMNASVAGAPEVDTELLDTEVREYLGKKVSNSMYDNPASRAKARIYDPKELLPLTTKGMPSKLEVFVPRGLSKDRAALFVFDLLSRNDGYYPISNSINDIVNLADTRFAVARLKNPLNLSTQDYLKEAKEVLQKIGIPFDDAFLEKNSQYFSKGLMRARDAMAPENQARSVKALISLIKEEKWLEFSDFMRTHRTILAQNERMRTYLEALLLGSWDDHARLRTVLLHGIDSALIDTKVTEWARHFATTTPAQKKAILTFGKDELISHLNFSNPEVIKELATFFDDSNFPQDRRVNLSKLIASQLKLSPEMENVLIATAKSGIAEGKASIGFEIMLLRSGDLSKAARSELLHTVTSSTSSTLHTRFFTTFQGSMGHGLDAQRFAIAFAKSSADQHAAFKSFFDSIEAVPESIRQELIKLAKAPSSQAQMNHAMVAAKFAPEAQKPLFESLLSRCGPYHNAYASSFAIDTAHYEKVFSSVTNITPEAMDALRASTRGVPIRADSLVQHLKRWFPNPKEFKEVAQELLLRSSNAQHGGEYIKQLTEFLPLTSTNETLLKSGIIRDWRLELQLVEEIFHTNPRDPYYQVVMARGIGISGRETSSFEALMKLPSLDDRALAELVNHLRSDSSRFMQPDTYPTKLLRKFIRQDASNLGPLAKKALFEYASEQGWMKTSFRDFCVELLGPKVSEPEMQLKFAQNLVRQGYESTGFLALQKVSALTEETQELLLNHLKNEARQWPHADTYSARLIEKFAKSNSPKLQEGLRDLSLNPEIRPSFRTFAGQQVRGPLFPNRAEQLAYIEALRSPGVETMGFEMLQKYSRLTPDAEKALIQAFKAESYSWPNPDTYPSRILQKFKSSLSPDGRRSLASLSRDESIRASFREFAKNLLKPTSPAKFARPSACSGFGALLRAK